MLYIHIPFCKSRCTYCSFYSTTLLDLREAYTKAVCDELERRGGEGHHTIYIGGGTPSTLDIGQLARIIEATSAHAVADERTIECNPDDVSPTFAADLFRLGFNRVSMGAQTFSPERLKTIGRRHTAGQTAAAVDNLRNAGITNISLDLMYGFPNQTLQDIEDDLRQLLALAPEHISTYCLSIEPGTAMYRQHLKPADDETACEMYFAIRRRLLDTGYEQYELSNFCRPGRQSRHNSGYWNGTPYTGIGAAAHSYDGRRLRSWNVSDIRQYIDGAEPEYEKLNDDELYNERVMLSLRTAIGLDLTELSPHFADYARRVALPLLESGMLNLDGQRLRLTEKSMFVSDMIIRDLMYQ